MGRLGRAPSCGLRAEVMGPSQLSREERGRDRHGWERPQGSAHLEAHIPSLARKGLSLDGTCLLPLPRLFTHPTPLTHAGSPFLPPPPLGGGGVRKALFESNSRAGRREPLS